MYRERLRLRSLSCCLFAAFACETSDSPTRSIDATRSDVRAAVSANATLAQGLVGALQETDGNLFYSPLSVESALGMLYAGAAGDTASQLKAALGAPDDAAEFHHGLGAVIDDLRSAVGNGYELAIANRVFTQTGATILPEFTTTLRDAYDASQQAVDFQHDVEAARMTIDAWVKSQTQGQIDELFKPGDLDPRSLLAIVNAVFFKAEWANAFDRARTQSSPFTLADGSTVMVPMMKLSEVTLRVGQFAGAMVVELPYRSADISFIGMLPMSPDGVPALEQAFAATEPSMVLAQLRSHESMVSLPRFTLHERLDLIPVLQKLGVLDLFDEQKANLTGIDGADDLFVHPLIHEARVSVDEVGTVAAAATGGGAVLTSGPVPVVFDHPFVFLIYDNLTGAVLFTGRVSDPTAD